MDRRSGTVLGMGIGLMVALTAYGVSQFFRGDTDEQIGAQSFFAPPTTDALLPSPGESPASLDAPAIDELSRSIVDVLNTH